MSDKILEELKTQTGEALQALRTAEQKFGNNSAEFKQVAEKTDMAFKKYDEQNAALVKSIEEAKTRNEDQTKRLNDMEVALARGTQGNGKAAFKNSEEFKQMMGYVKTGAPIEIKTMRGDSSTDGGYLMPTEMANEIIKSITEISPVRQIARVRTIGKKTIEIPKRTSIPVAQYEGEEEAAPQSQAAYGNETLTAHRLAVEVVYTRDLLIDSAFNLDSEISGDVAEAFAKAEGAAFVSGNGVKKPEGFLANAELVAGAVDTLGSGVITADDLLLLTGQLKQGYQPYFGFNRLTLAKLRTLKGTTNDHYLWQMGLAPDAPATIGGDPYIVLQDMPDIATGALSVVYGDFRKGYQITDRTGLMVIRDEVTGARNALVKLNFMRWNHGQVVLSEAFKLLRVKA